MLLSPLAIVRRLPPPVPTLIAGTFVNKAGSFILPYLTLVLAHEFRLPERQAAGLVVAYGVGSLVSLVVGGHLTDRLGRRSTLLLSLFGSGALAVAMSAASSVRVFVPLLLLFGFLADLYRPASSAIISDRLRSAERAGGFAALRVAVNLGFACGMAVGGLLVDWSWRVLFAADGLTTIAFGAIVLLRIGETRPSAHADASAAAAAPWRDPVFAQVLLASLGFATMVLSFVTVLPLSVTRSAGYPAWVFGVLVAVNGLIIAVFELSAVEALRGARRLRVAALGMLLAGLGFGMLGLVRHWGGFLAGMVLWTIGEILTVPQQMAFVADWAPPEARGRYLGFYGATWSLAVVLNPLLTLPLYARLPEPYFWPLHLLLVVPGLLLLRLDRVADRRERLRGRIDGEPAPPALPALASEP
ncbi:MAG TPA: MFS transporter [Vicinamibacteria bacterium]|nr:MFS transporter [Vicinamibacteria bacterium]